MKSKLDLKRAIKDHNFTNADVAGKLGVTVPSLYSYFKGNPSVETIYRIADILGEDPRDLFYPVDDAGNVISHADENTSRTNAAVSQAVSQYAVMLEARDKRIADLESELAILKQTSSGHEAPSPSDVQKSSPMPGTEMPVGSVVPAYKAYVCPHCGTKFAIFDEK